ncbi:hypothetical protein SAMN02745248_00791 [Hathewaya proteolytica DSM 3090]|uniref:Uncharacterized protein n=1 Tax=Hathewaya proteolytica DSM 3090 TaxID=1121331 RepID=A0A1M6LRG3_9CLOT|nr:DUF6508 domain-containing protein [Hathewaya proteolytica]SHJ73755.1 hypothetical protein SAMN02745248_00791 [Hathewaya proteolytica DSM 3090]
MTNIEKKEKLQILLAKNTGREESYYTCLEEMDDLKTNYNDYMTTAPIDVETELKRLSGADYDLCVAFLTMLLREDHFSNGAFERRYRDGQVTAIVERMIELL